MSQKLRLPNLLVGVTGSPAAAVGTVKCGAGGHAPRRLPGGVNPFVSDIVRRRLPTLPGNSGSADGSTHSGLGSTRNSMRASQRAWRRALRSLSESCSRLMLPFSQMSRRTRGQSALEEKPASRGCTLEKARAMLVSYQPGSLGF